MDSVIENIKSIIMIILFKMVFNSDIMYYGIGKIYNILCSKIFTSISLSPKRIAVGAADKLKI